MSLFDVLTEFYGAYIEHGISNLNWIVYLGGLIALSIDAGIAGDAQGFVEMVFYAVLFTGMAWILEIFFGTGTIRYLDEAWPYYDDLLLPSWLYLFIEHEYPILDYEVVEENPRIDRTAIDGADGTDISNEPSDNA
jgi:hypothetical protein